MPLVFRGNASYGRRRDSLWVEDDPPEEVVFRLFLSRDVLLPRCEDGSFCVIGSEDHWELCVVDPSAFPIYLWLCSSKPLISEDGLLLAKFGKIESKIGMVGRRLYL